jgi:hypothetical protein
LQLREKLGKLLQKDYMVVVKQSKAPLLHVQKRQLDTTKPYSKRSLFQKYTFFNAGIFMGLFSMFIVALISYYAMGMLLGLQTPTRFETPVKK